MTPMLVVLTLVIVTITFLPYLRHSHWLVRGLDFPRLQFAIIASIVLALNFVFLDLSTGIAQLLTGVTGLCLIVQLWWVLPYTRLWPKQVLDSSNSDPARQVSVITSNVLTPNRNALALIDLVQQYEPDIVVTLESDQWWENALQVIELEMPHSVKCPLDNLYGMHVYSRLPLHDAEVCYLVEDDVPSIHVSIELRTGDRVRAHFLHPAPPSPTENTESTERDAELVVVARSVQESDDPVIVTGDLNDVAWSGTARLFRKISGLLDPRVGRGMFNTFHAGYFFLRWPLDHLFHSKHFTLRSIQRLPSIGSDHFALLTRLTFNPASGDSQASMQARAVEKQWADDIAQDTDARKEDVPKPGK